MVGMEELKKNIALEPGEKIIKMYKVETDSIPKKVIRRRRRIGSLLQWAGVHPKYERDSEICVLTNRNLLFYQKHGYFRISYRLSWFVELKEIKSIEIKTALSPYVEMNGFNLYPEEVTAEDLADDLMTAVEEATRE